MTELKISPLKAIHISHQAKLVPFAGWEMPIHYGSQLNEHHMVRQSVGLFDVSHMGIVDIQGQGAQAYLRMLLANDVARLQNGRALYSCMLNPEGGVIDDVIVYQHHLEAFTMVINAGTTDKDWVWINQNIKHQDCQVQLKNDWAMIAIQGPEALSAFQKSFPELGALITACKPFGFVATMWERHSCILARTGYTGEDGLEVMMPDLEMITFVQKLVDEGVQLCGLGARDTLRLEAGMPLYGQEMDEGVTPYEAALGWTVHLGDESREFIGRKALESRLPRFQTKGIIALEKQGVFRSQQTIVSTAGSGVLTSGGFSPTIGKSIAMARLPLAVELGDVVSVEVRGNAIPAKVVPCAMVKRGTILV